MKYLKKFENFDLGRFDTDDENDENDWIDEVEDIEDKEDDLDEWEREEDDREEDEREEDEDERRSRVWGDENTLEKKKMNAGFKAYLDKQKAKKAGNDKDKKCDKCDNKKCDCDKKGKKEEVKGLTAKQKKLPEGLQKAILAKKKK